jgi:glycosyltransferase involved in cell wall biosynthesis
MIATPPLADRELTLSIATARAAQRLARYRIAVVMPAYNEAARIADTLQSIPSYVRHIIVVDDCSRDATSEVIRRLAEEDERIELIRHEKNQGVGGAMITGLTRARELQAQLIVKMDSDGQMSPDDLPALLRPLINGQADFAKGNRFHDFLALTQMPPIRRAGNMALSFLTKAAVGYWNIADPCNGYVAIRGEVLSALPISSLQRSYFFETSLLGQLFLLGAVIRDVPMPARYGNEQSKLRVTRILLEFPPKLLGCLFRRLVLKNFIYDFSMESLYLLAAMPLLVGGALYGGWNWLWYASLGVGAPTGTVVIPAMLIILGFQLLLSALVEDVRNVPQRPLCGGSLPEDDADDDLSNIDLPPSRRSELLTT